MRLHRAAACALAVLLYAGAGLAQSASGAAPPAASPPPDPWSFTVGATTDYARHGTLRGQDDIEFLGSAQWSPNGNVYVSAAPNTAAIGDSDWELDLTAGVQPKWGGWTWNISVSRIEYFGDSGDVDNWEFNAQTSRAFGKATWTLQTGASPDYEGPGKEAVWAQGSLGWALNDQVSLVTGLGAQDQAGGPDYVWWQAGVTVAVTPALSLDLHWYDTDNAAALGVSGDGQAVAALTFSF